MKYSVIPGNTFLGTKRYNMASDTEAYNTVSKIVFLYSKGHKYDYIDYKFSATETKKQEQLLVVEVCEDYRGQLGTVMKLEMQE